MLRRDKKGKIFESLGKNVQHLKIFWKRASDSVQLLHADRIGPVNLKLQMLYYTSCSFLSKYFLKLFCLTK